MDASKIEEEDDDDLFEAPPPVPPSPRRSREAPSPASPTLRRAAPKLKGQVRRRARRAGPRRRRRSGASPMIIIIRTSRTRARRGRRTALPAGAFPRQRLLWGIGIRLADDGAEQRRAHGRGRGRRTRQFFTKSFRRRKMAWPAGAVEPR